MEKFYPSEEKKKQTNNAKNNVIKKSKLKRAKS